MSSRPLKVAWYSYFPIEWLPNLPPELQGLQRQHPATWQRVLWDQFKTDFDKDTHIRIHPLLHWTELNIWEYIERENIPIIPLYFSCLHKSRMQV